MAIIAIAVMSERIYCAMDKPSVPILLVLDTNCFIDAVSPLSHAHASVSQLFDAAAQGVLEIRVNLHSFHELEEGAKKYGADALELARRQVLLPYFPIGRISELLGTIDGLAGTFDDMDSNHDLQEKLGKLALAGADLRDRGALVDAIAAKAKIFVTSDGQLSKKGPAERIRDRVGIEVLTPKEMALRL